ncbi:MULTISPECIES: LacI family DNA-binding transcriptional regulator [Rhodonellum]|nr:MULTISPECIES: LacI family DNA-binding transcriptional regulator [Rhodonellum]
MKKDQSKISIKDVARELGLSITTISFIINNKAKNRISDEVIKKVEDYIEKVGYKPNASAQSLRTGKSNTIVFMAEDISDPFFSTIAKEMEDLAFNNGYKIIYCSTENKKERALELLSTFKDRQIDAFIITPPEDFEDEINALIAENRKIVLFDRHYNDPNHNYVVLDNYNSCGKAVKSLLEEGFENIAFVGLESNLSPMKERLEGYMDAVKNNQKHPISLLIKFDEVKSAKGKQVFENLLKEHPNIDAILFSTNSLAITGLRVLREVGKRLPEDIGVITFDDRELFELHSPPISVVSQPVSELAEELIKGTLNLLKSRSKSPKLFQVSLPGKLILRKSSMLESGAASGKTK